MLQRLQSKIIGLIAVISGLIYIEWLSKNLNWSNPTLAVYFFAMTLLGIIPTVIHVLNNNRQKKEKLSIINKSLPNIAVVIPTWREPLFILQKTLDSYLRMNYPFEKLLIIVSDDAQNKEIESYIEYFKQKHRINIVYFKPHSKNSIKRRGEGKAGNLNSVMSLINSMGIFKYIEIRDADDLVGDRNFLKYVIQKLEGNKRIAFVQGIKEAFVSKGDPFSNREKMFYQSLMLSKNAANAVFPCGSGLVWRTAAVNNIGGFPDWNIVEDFQSGAEAIKKGWDTCYVPVVAAVAQKGPEDLANTYKQRSVWAMDSLRFLFWGDKRGMNLKQKLHFMESGIFYIYSAIFYLQGFLPIYLLLTNQSPVNQNLHEYWIYLSTYLLSVYMYIWSLRKGKSIRSKDVITSIQMGFGLGPIYLQALIKTLMYGKNKKPKYILTKKTDTPSLYIWEVMPQIILIGLSIFAVVIHLTTNTENSYDYSSIFWALFYIEIYSKIVKNSWFNFKLKLPKINDLIAFESI